MTGSLKHFGVLAHSAEGAALCFTTFCHEGAARLGPDIHPDVSLDCIAFGHCMRAWEVGDYDYIRAVHARSAARLAAAGADFFACPDNTSHIALEYPGPELALPGLNIADVVADEATQRGMTRVGILGTRYTMEGPVYPRALGARGVEVDAGDAAERADSNRIVFEELVRGAFRPESRQRYQEIIAAMKARGCDGVALVCTEIPMLVSGKDTPLPILDSTRLLARAAVDVATGAKPMPSWRGGPVDGASAAAAE
jgi:aspartate racemase